MKYLALDIGNVICHTPMNTYFRNLSATFNVPVAEAARFMKSFQQFHDLGMTSLEHQLRHYFGCKSETTIDRLTQSWGDCVFPNLPMIEMLQDLVENHEVKLALLSNIGTEHAELMSEKLYPIFDNSIKHFSCFVGVRKPTTLYYQSFLWQYPEFQGALYVDDLQENLITSHQFGFKTIQFSLEDKDHSEKIGLIKVAVLNTQ